MANPINKKLADLLGKMDDKMLEAKINKALDMLKNGDPDELAKKLNKIDKEELIGKINDFDLNKLQDLNINKDEIKKNVNDADLQKLSSLIGTHGDEIVKKLRDIMNK